MNFVDEKNLPVHDAAQDAGEVQLLLQHGAGGLREGDVKLLRDDRRKGGFAQAGRAVEQHVVHGFSTLAGGVDGDLEVLFEACLTCEIGQAAGAQAHFKLLFIVTS